jgi:hypothetical protein
VVVVIATPPANGNDNPPWWITSLLPNGSTPLANFIISPPLPPITIVFGCGGSHFASNSGAGSERNNFRWQSDSNFDEAKPAALQ